AARSAAAHGGLSVAESRENAAFERHPPPVGHPAARPRGRVRGRSGHSSESENRPGLDDAWATERSANPGAERETVSGRSVGRARATGALGGGRTQDQRFVHRAAAAPAPDLPAGTGHSRYPRQLSDSR